MLVFNTYFYKNKKLKLHFGDRVDVINHLIYGYGGSIIVFSRFQLFLFDHRCDKMIHSDICF
jgi:hypothetical protein